MKRRKRSGAGLPRFVIAAVTFAVIAAMGTCLTYQLRPEWLLWLSDEKECAAEIHFAAAKHGVPEPLVRALIRRESRFRIRARGARGEIGLMQLLPSGAAAEWARVNKCAVPSEFELFQVKTNLDIGCWYLARALRRWEKYRCQVELALAQYNAGEVNANRWKPAAPGGDVISRITFPGTRDYVIAIMKYYQQEVKKFPCGK